MGSRHVFELENIEEVGVMLELNEHVIKCEPGAPAKLQPPWNRAQ